MPPNASCFSPEPRQSETCRHPTDSTRSGYLDEVGGGADEDRHARKHFQVDLTGKYQVTKNVQLVGELVNIFDEPYTAYQRFEGRNRLLQYEEYGITAKFGVRASF